MPGTLQALPYAQEQIHEGSTGERILELDGLRGIAILLVITKHYGVACFPGESSWVTFLNRLYGTLSGVDLFFVLTGFLLGTRLLATIDSQRYYSSFYFRRVCRTFPLYYVLLVLFTAAMLARDFLGPVIAIQQEWPFGTPWSLAAYAVALQNFWIAATGSLGPSWLMITWSLAVQEQFYLLLPWMLRRAHGRAMVFVLAGLFLAAPLSRLMVTLFVPESRWNGFDCLLFCRTDTLGVGVLAVWILRGAGARNWLESAHRLLFPTTAILFIAYASFVYCKPLLGSTVPFVVGHTFLAVLYMGLVLSAVFASQGLVGALLRSTILRELGRISYGLFLFHQMVHDVTFQVVLGTPTPVEGWESWLATFDAFLATVLLAELAWHFVEKPLIAWSKSR